VKIESHRDLQLLRAVEQEPLVTQRILASRFGMALGLTNTCLKRLANRGYIECISRPSHRFFYKITSRGLTRLIRLTREYVRHSLESYADARREVRQTLHAALDGQRRIVLLGTDEAAEVAYLCLKEAGLEPVAIFGDTPGHAFLGIPIRDLRELKQLEFDLILCASFESAASALRRLLKEGIPSEKIVHLPSILAVANRLPAKRRNRERRTSQRDSA
jgi:hypothetical protein